MAGLPLPKRKEVCDELRAHLADAIEHRVARGSDRALAEQEAVAALGDVETLNRELLRAHFGRKWPLYFFIHTFGWWLPELPRIRLRPKFTFWKYADKYRRQYAEGRYDEIIERLERELATDGPSDTVHSQLGLAYNAIGEHERALTHLQAEVDLLKADPNRWRSRGGEDVGLAGAYSNLAGVLETLGREDEAEAARDAGLAADDRLFLLNYQKAKYCVRGGDFDGTLQHLAAVLKENEDDVTKGGHGKTLLLILSTDVFDPVRKDPRFSTIAHRAYSSLPDAKKTLGSEYEDLAAMPDGLTVDGEEFLLHCEQAKCCLERGDPDGAFHRLEASLDAPVKNGNPGTLLLLSLSAATFDPLRKVKRFAHLLDRAYHCP